MKRKYVYRVRAINKRTLKTVDIFFRELEGNPYAEGEVIRAFQAFKQDGSVTRNLCDLKLIRYTITETDRVLIAT